MQFSNIPRCDPLLRREKPIFERAEMSERKGRKMKKKATFIECTGISLLAIEYTH